MSQHLKIKRCSNCRAPLDNKRRLIHCTSRLSTLLFGGKKRQMQLFNIKIVRNERKHDRKCMTVIKSLVNTNWSWRAECRTSLEDRQ